MKSGKILILFVSLLASISMWGMHPEGGPMADSEVDPASSTGQSESPEDLPDGNSKESDLEDANGKSKSGSSISSPGPFLNQDAFGNGAQGQPQVSDPSQNSESSVSETMNVQSTPQSATEMNTSLTRGTSFNRGGWRKNVDTLFESWGDRVKNAFNSAQETLGQVFTMDGAGIEPQHSLVVNHIETEPDQNALGFKNTKAKATVEFGDLDFKPRGWKEAFKDFFTRGTTRKQVQALEKKADELENNIINATDRSLQDSDLKKMSVVLDKLEFERRNLHRKWWEFKKSETKLQELQRKGEAKEVKENNYYTLLNKRANALRKMLLTSGDENDGLVRLATPKELEEAISVAEEEDDIKRVEWLKKARDEKIKDEKQKAFDDEKHSKLVQNFDGILKKYQDAQSPEQVEEFKKQLDDYAEQFNKRLEKNNFSFSTEPSDLWNRLKILESDAFKDRTLNLDQWGAVVKNSSSSGVRPKVLQSSDFDPEYTNNQQQLMEQRVAKRAAEDARIADIRRQNQEEVSATLNKLGVTGSVSLSLPKPSGRLSFAERKNIRNNVQSGLTDANELVNRLQNNYSTADDEAIDAMIVRLKAIKTETLKDPFLNSDGTQIQNKIYELQRVKERQQGEPTGISVESNRQEDPQIFPSSGKLMELAQKEQAVGEAINAVNVKKVYPEFYSDWKGKPEETAQALVNKAEDFSNRKADNRASNEELLETARKLKYIADKLDALGNTKSKTAEKLSSELRDQVESRLNSLESMLAARNIEFTPLQDTEDPAEDGGNSKNNNSTQYTKEPLSTTVENSFFQPTQEELEEERKELLEAFNGLPDGNSDSTGKALSEPTKTEKAEILKQEKKAQKLKRKLAKEQSAQAKKNEFNLKKARKKIDLYLHEYQTGNPKGRRATFEDIKSKPYYPLSLEDREELQKYWQQQVEEQGLLDQIKRQEYIKNTPNLTTGARDLGNVKVRKGQVSY